MEDRSAALFDTGEQPCIVQPATPPGASQGPRRFAAFVLCFLCLMAFTALLLIYALVSLPEWLSLLVGVTLVLLFLGLILSLGLVVGAVTAQEPGEWT